MMTMCISQRERESVCESADENLLLYIYIYICMHNHVPWVSCEPICQSHMTWPKFRAPVANCHAPICIFIFRSYSYSYLQAFFAYS